MLDLLKYRETVLYTQLVGETKRLIKEEKQSPYQVLMRETSDVMQDLALAYGERNTLEYCISTLSTLSNQTNK